MIGLPFGAGSYHVTITFDSSIYVVGVDGAEGIEAARIDTVDESTL